VREAGFGALLQIHRPGLTDDLCLLGLDHLQPRHPRQAHTRQLDHRSASFLDLRDRVAVEAGRINGRTLRIGDPDDPQIEPITLPDVVAFL